MRHIIILSIEIRYDQLYLLHRFEDTQANFVQVGILQLFAYS